MLPALWRGPSRRLLFDTRNDVEDCRNHAFRCLMINHGQRIALTIGVGGIHDRRLRHTGISES